MCDVEILWLAEKGGFRVKEIGVTWRDDGDSRLQLVSGNLRNVRDLLRIRAARYERPLGEPSPALIGTRTEV